MCRVTRLYTCSFLLMCWAAIGVQGAETPAASPTGPALAPRAVGVDPPPKQIDWSKQIVYFVLIDRFFNGDPSNDTGGNPASHIKPGAAPGEQHLKSYQGGDLLGVLEKLDYLKDLGVTVLWLSPVFKNDSQEFKGLWPYHGYHPYDHYTVEEHFGDITLLRRVVDEAHKRDLKVVIDMVYNQVSRQHPWVRDPENFEQKGFKTWFHPHSFEGEEHSIKDWKDQNELETKELFWLPDFDQDNPNVHAFLLDVSRYWIQQTGADGFRLDAVKHINPRFWKRINGDLHRLYGNDFLMMGEIFEGDVQYVAKYRGLGFNAIFDIPLYYTLRNVFAAGGSMELLSDQLRLNLKVFNSDELLGNLIDNHDVVRFSFRAESQVREKIRLAMTFINALNGIPIVYYGTEVVLEGGPESDEQGLSTDYLNRRMFPWERVAKESAPGGMIDYFRKLFAFRKAHRALSAGKLVELAKDPVTYAFAKVAPDDLAVAMFNNSESSQTVEAPVRYDLFAEGDRLTGFLDGETVTVKDHKLTVELPPLSARIFAMPNTAKRALPPDYEVGVKSTGRLGSDFRLIRFRFQTDEADVRTVALAGEFNGWNPRKDALKFNQESKTWELSYPLRKGKYRYKFVINGETWIPDLNAQEFENNSFGTKNSIVVVGDEPPAPTSSSAAAPPSDLPTSQVSVPLCADQRRLLRPGQRLVRRIQSCRVNSQ